MLAQFLLLRGVTHRIAKETRVGPARHRAWNGQICFIQGIRTRNCWWSSCSSFRRGRCMTMGRTLWKGRYVWRKTCRRGRRRGYVPVKEAVVSRAGGHFSGS